MNTFRNISAALVLTLATLGGAVPTIALGQDSAATTAGETAATKLNLAREIIALGYPEETREEMFFAVMDQMSGQVRQSVLGSIDVEDAGAIAIIDSWLAERQEESKALISRHLPAMMEGFAAAHADAFSEQELRDIRAFVGTPSGQGYLARSTSLGTHPAFTAASQAYLDESFGNLEEEMGVLMQRLQEYSELSSGQ